MAKKHRGNNEGSISKRKDGRWTGQVTVGINPATGKPKRKTFYGKTRKDVADKVNECLVQVQSGTFVEPSKTTLGEWLDRWLTVYKKGQVKQGTYESYETNIEAHIKPELGDIPLANLQPNTLQSFFNDKLEHGRKDGGSLSTRMVRYFYTIINQALKQAVKEGLLTRNVAEATNPPTIRNKKVNPLTEKQLVTFLEHVKHDRLFPAYLLAATTGVRRGELLGLCWDSVDLENGAITIQRQLSTLKSGLVLEETTKSESGRRKITLTDDALKELKSHRVRQLEEKLYWGKAYQNNNLLFCKEDGTFIDPREFTKKFQQHLEAAGLPKVRLHDLRHTHASLLLARGVHAKVVQERLGHSSITMTLDLYTHMMPGLDEAAAASLNGLLSKEKSPAKAGQSQ